MSPNPLTVIVAVASFGPKITFPAGSTPPAKSAALAGVPPLPVTAKSTLAAADKSPKRDTVKVNGVEPELPSALLA